MVVSERPPRSKKWGYPSMPERADAARHTPGEWRLAKARPVKICGEDVSCFEISASASAGWIAAVQKHPNVGQDGEANARLIAAAPDLLEACRQAKKYLDPELVEPGRTLFWRLVEVIAKAEGQ